MTDDTAALSIRLQADIRRLEAALKKSEKRVQASAAKINRKAKELDDRLSEVGRRFGVHIPARGAAAAAAIAAVGLAVRQVVREGDKIRSLEARFKALTGDAERGAAKVQAVFDIVGSSGGTIDGAAAALTRFTIAADALDVTDAQVVELTQNIIRLGQIGGSTSQEIESGATQLGQALASGVLQGEELKSILENLPLVARQLADGLNVGVGELRAMGAAGQLTADRVFGALIKNTDEVNRKFEQAIEGNARIAQQRLVGAFSNVVSKINEATGASRIWAGVLNGIADQLEELADSEDRLTERLSGAFGIPKQGTGEKAGTDEQLRKFLGGARVQEIGGPLVDPVAASPNRRPELTEAQRTALELAYGRTANRPNDLSGNRSGFSGLPSDRELNSARGGGGGGATESALTASLNNIRDQIQLLEDQRGAIGLTGRALAEYEAQIEAVRMASEFESAAREEGLSVTAQQKAEVDDLTGSYVKLAIAIAEQTEKAEAGRAATEGLKSAIAGSITNAKTASDAMRNLAQSIGAMLIQAAFGQGALGGLFKTSGLNFGEVAVNSILPNKNGNAFQGGRVLPFANGGVVSAPTTFPMQGGNLGLMGEAGPEAIMPLSKGPDGRLGVAGGTPANVTINVTTPDADSFRRSERQIANSIANAIRRAQKRNN